MTNAPRSMTAIVAATMSNGIGQNGSLPWRLPSEMKYFARVTTGEHLGQGEHNAVVMGRKTWESIPTKFRPLKGRLNLVISRAGIDVSDQPLSSSHSSIPAALSSLPSDTQRMFLIGGAQLYNLSLDDHHSSPLVDRVLLTRIVEPELECDTFLVDFTRRDAWRRASHGDLCEWVGFEVPEGEVEEKGIKYRYEMWVRR